MRGGILDVFPPTEEHPLRVEFWGDTVEEVRWFKVADQRSLEVADGGLWAPPCRELLLTDAVRARAAVLAEQLPGVADMLGKVAEGIAVEGMESLAPVLVDGMESLLDLLPPGTHVSALRPGAGPGPGPRPGRDQRGVPRGEPGRRPRPAGSTPVDLGRPRHYVVLVDVAREHALAGAGLVVDDLAVRPGPTPSRRSMGVEDGPRRRVLAAVAVPEAYRGDRERAIADVGGWLARRLAGGAGHRGPRPGRAAGRDAARGRPRRPAGRRPADRPNRRSSTSRPARWAAASSPGRKLARGAHRDRPRRASGRRPRTCARCRARRRNIVDPLQLRPGDYVVHEQHGVGRFVEMVQRTGRRGATREYLVIEYAPSKRGQPGDRLYVPTDQLDQVTRYVGGEAPTLNKLGGSDWAKTKGRARKAVSEIAAELIRLYSARMASRRATRSARTRRGSASSRTRSPTSRRPTSWPPSTRSRPTWSGRSRWTG